MRTDHTMRDQPENIVSCGLIDSAVHYNEIIIYIIRNWHEITGNMSIFIVIATRPSYKITLSALRHSRQRVGVNIILVIIVD